MILSDDEVRAADEYGGGYNMPTIKDLTNSHLEANSRIRELEAALEDRTNDRLAVIADALAGELQYIYDFWQKEEIEIAKAKGVLISKELTWCVERTDIMDRADRAEAKLLELKSSPDNFYELYKQEQARAEDCEAKLRELVKTIDRLDKRKEEGSQILAKLISYGPGTSPEGDKWIKANRANVVNLRNAEAAYRAALKAAKEG